MVNSGIYKIQNHISNKCYIGSSVDIYYRMKDHRQTLEKNKHCNIKLQRAWNKYGENAFEFEVIEVLDEHKRKISESLRGKVGSNTGHFHTDVAKKKMSEKLKGKIPWNKGKTIMFENKKKCYERMKTLK